MHRRKKSKLKMAYREMDESINKFFSRIGKKLQIINCNLIKKNHKYSVHTRKCLRCEYMKKKYRNETSNSQTV